MKHSLKMIAGLAVLAFTVVLMPAGAEELLGIEADGDIFRFTTTPGNCVATLVGAASVSQADEHNALAYDQTNQRIYYATFPLGCPNPPAVLSFWDVVGGAVVPAGELTGCAANAEFDKGAYYYVDDGTDDLYRVTFFNNGTIKTQVKVADVFGDGENLFFGDIALRNDDLMFGRSADISFTTNRQFVYDTVADSLVDDDGVTSLLQLSFGADGTSTLYGQAAADSEVFTLNQSTGAENSICNNITNGGPFTDLAGFRPRIDIKPGSDPSCFNINGHGSIPVVIFGSDEGLDDDVDVEDIDQETLEFGGMPVKLKKGVARCSIKDVDGDGLDDLVCKFEDTGTFVHSDGTACVTGDFISDGGFEFCNDICLSSHGQ